MIILPFMEEAICYCNNAKLTIESFSYLGQLNNYITLLIQPVRKFFRAGCSCFYSLFSLQGFFLKIGKGSLYFFQTVSRKACGIFYPVYFVAPVLAFIFIKQVIVIFSCPLVKFPLVLKRLCFAALIAAQLIPLALCQKIFSADLAPPEAKPPVIQSVQIIGNQRVEGRIGRHTFFCAPVVREPEVKPDAGNAETVRHRFSQD